MTDTRPRSKRSTSPCRTKRSLAFNSPSSASARDRNVPVRFGKWSREEDAYLEKLIMLFQSGLLAEIEVKTSLRAWLAQMLNCCPMRISKKQMHGHQFEGKAKYKRSSSNLDSMTQQQYDTLCNELWQLRAAFLKAWAKDEYGRRSAKIRTKEMNFSDWYDRVLKLVPTPKIAKRSSLNEYTIKRKIESLEELRREMHEETKRQKVEMLVEIRETTTTEQTYDIADIKSFASVEIAPLEPAPISFSSALISSPTISAMPAQSTAYCGASGSMGDWLTDFDDRVYVAQVTDTPRVIQKASEAPYTFCDDQVQVSVHLHDQQHSLAESHTSSGLVIDFGAPSCWHSDEVSSQTPFCDYLHWTDNDLTEEFAMSMEPGIFGWGNSSPTTHMTCSPTLNFL